MRPYLLSLGAGLLVGVVYGLLRVRSPAPPVIALVGLFGILAGEQLVPLARHLLSDGMPNVAWLKARAPHMFGSLPASTAEASEPRDHA